MLSATKTNRAPLLLAALLLAVVAAGPTAARAQLIGFNFCTLFQNSPQTEDVISSVTDDWDSGAGAWDAQTRNIFTYDGGNPTELLVQERVQSSWRDTLRTQGEFDSGGRNTRCTIQERKEGQFVNSIRLNSTYDGSGQLQTEITQVWDTTDAEPNGTFVNASRSTYSYDGSGNVERRVDEAWDGDAEEWINSTRVTNTYDAQDRLVEEVTEVTDGQGGWMNSSRTSDTYGPDGITESLDETWDIQTSSWQNDSRTQYSYPSDDQEVDVFQNWDGSAWVNEERTTTDLNANDLPERQTTEMWDGSNWVNSDRNQQSYTTEDGTQKIEVTRQETWDAGTSAWVNDSRTTYSYSDVIPVELAGLEAILEHGEVALEWTTLSETNSAGFEVQHRPDGQQEWTDLGFVESKAPGGTTSESLSYRFDAGTMPPGTHHFRLEQVDLDGTTTLSRREVVEIEMVRAVRFSEPSPNPVSTVATLSFSVNEPAEARIRLFNILGQRLRTLFDGVPSPGVNQTLRFDTKGLPNGIYFLQLEVDGQTRMRRLTVVR